MKTFHDCDIPLIEEQREWEKACDRSDSIRFRNLMIGALCMLIACVVGVVWLRG